jgi:PAS domain S-box-containing protein
MGKNNNSSFDSEEYFLSGSSFDTERSKFSLSELEKLVRVALDSKRLKTEDKHEISLEFDFVKECLGLIERYHFKECMDNFFEGIYIADSEGKTLYVNKAYLKMTGLKREDVIDKYVDDLIKSGVFHNAVTPEVIKHKKVVSSIGKARNGVDMLITGEPIFSKTGELIRVIVSQRDFSQLSDLKKELECSQRKIAIAEDITRKKEEEIEYLRKQHLNVNFISASEEMKRIDKLINQVARLDATVLITGESGVGKEVVANEIFRKSDRSTEPFVKVNCAAIPGNLLEAELFGYEKGAFTGATSTKIGLFELADKGTLMLDEIGEMEISIQAKLLRAIQHKQITRIGGSKVISLDVRIIAATNANLFEMVKAGKFREDLYYRINVFPISVLPLRSRKEDIIELAKHFLGIYNSKYNKRVILNEEAFLILQKYSWPGNVRELQNIIERLVIISETGSYIVAEQIAGLLMIDLETALLGNSEKGLKAVIEDIERELIRKALNEAGSTRKAAKILRISQSGVVKKMKKLGMGGDYK